MSDTIRGFWVALASPVASDGRLDRELFASHARTMMARGADGVVAFGTTGEGPSFSAAERMQGVDALLEAGIAPDRIGLGSSFPSSPDTVSLIRNALAAGLVHMLVLPPYFFRDAPPEGIEDAFAAIIDAVADARVRMTLYNIPQVAGIAVPPQTAAALRRRYGPCVAGIKDSSAQFPQFQAYRRAAPDLAVTVGHEPDIARAMAEGGVGTICGLGNIVPDLMRSVVDGGGSQAAVEELVASFTNHAFVPTLKSVLAATAGTETWATLRPPLRAADAAVGRRIAELVRPAATKAA